MTLVSNDPSWWPFINASRISGYFVVAASAAVLYDCVLTFGREVELVWRQRWSLMTFLYLSVRYLGMLCAVVSILTSGPTISLKDAGCRVLCAVLNGTNAVVYPLLGVIMISRLHAMYQQSRTVMIPVVVIFIAVNITTGVIGVISIAHTSGEEFILSGTYMCALDVEGDATFLSAMTWILGTVWEVLALCLAVRVAVKHFCDLRRQSAGGILGDCFMVLMKTHMGYFASFAAVSCFTLCYEFSPVSADMYSLEYQIYGDLDQIFSFVQMFVLGPRLILGVREYHAKLVANSDAATAMTSIVFQEHVHVSTSSV